MTEKARSGPAKLWNSLYGWVQLIISVGVLGTMMWGFHQWSVKVGEERGARAVIQRNMPERVDDLEAVVFEPGYLRDRVADMETTVEAIADEYSTIRTMREDIRRMDAKIERVVCLAEVQADLRPAFECR